MMLVLGRKVNESIIIGDNVVVTVLAVDGERVKIGIDAPTDISIMRQELYDAVKKENLRAVKAAQKRGDAMLSSLQVLLEQKKKRDK